MLLLIIIVALLASFYWYVKRTYSHWPDRGVQQLKPVPIFGNTFWTFTRQQSLSELTLEVYNSAPDKRYVGMYQFVLPILLLRDPELIKQIAVKDFDIFSDHRTVIPAENDQFWGNSLFTLKGETWHNMRSTLSPAYSNSKMKFMFDIMTESAQGAVRYFMKKNEEVSHIEMKDLASRYCNDAIVTTAFGVKVNSLDDPNNEFYEMGVKATDFSSLLKNLKMFSYVVFPLLSRAMNITFFPEDVRSFFRNLVNESIKVRTGKKIVWPDLMDLLLKRKDKELKYKESKATDAEVMDTDMMSSQALIFFFAAWDVASSAMCFMAYELALNPDIQERLRNEILEANEECGGTITHDRILKLQYLDMVISESLRKWPIGVAVDRVCTQPYTIEAEQPGEKPIHLKKGDVVWLPIIALHRDPNHFPNPDKFDPERFNEENKGNIKPYTYVPFGVGPRICIGNRFALQEIKVFFFHILIHFEIVPTEKTQIPLVINKRSFGLHAEHGFCLGLKKRVTS